MDIFKKYDFPQKSAKFRLGLIKKRGLRCEKCGLTEWLGQPINIEMHHIDGDKSNNTLDNLMLLCPNCHSYTDNYGSKNKKSIQVSDEELTSALQQSYSIRQALFSLGLSDAGGNYTRARKLLNDQSISLLATESKKENFCIDCGKPICTGAERCSNCASKHSRIVDRPTREELKALIRVMPFTRIGAKFGVSDNAIRRWCDSYNLPRKTTEIKKITKEEWERI